MLIQPPDPQLLSIKKGASSGKLVRHLATVGQVFSAEDELGATRFPPEFLQDVRLLKYAQFLFLPKGGALTRDSLLRLDELQSVVVDQLEPTEHALAPELAEVVRAQMSYYSTGLSGEAFTQWADLLQQ